MFIVNIFIYSFIYSSCNLPTKHGNFELDIHKYNNLEIPVLYKKFITNPSINNNHKFPLVRIHDCCLTSEVFDSFRCDCDQQLKLSMKLINNNGGIIIYLPNEGRGIGLSNKIKAYYIQDTLNLDTYEANNYLNLPEDCRQYDNIPSILNQYNFNSINLLTNSKIKYNRLLDLNIKINIILNI
jgi:GTP cyclohydrolase II